MWTVRVIGAEHGYRPAVPSAGPSPFTPRPKPQRLEYFEHSGADAPRAAAPPAPLHVASARPTVREAVLALLHHHSVDWSVTTRRNAEYHLLKGRWPEFLAHHGIGYIDQLSTAMLEDYMTVHAGVLKPATLVKYRTYAQALARFCATHSAYASPLLDDARDLPKPRVSRRKLPVALSADEELAVLAAAAPGRDRLIVATFLATGLRVGELCALSVRHIDGVRETPPRLRIVGNVHNRDTTKGRRDRMVGFRDAYRSLPSDLAAWADDHRPVSGVPELFLSARGEALTTWGVEQLMQRVGRAAGIRCNPHRLRHTWATRCADAGMPVFHLQLLGGWESVEMARRYYTASDVEAINSLSRFRS